MAPAPAVIIIARHGARLDAADKSWHLTSPAPYDPPLTYGGWTQCKALGVRIGSLLHQREQEQDFEASFSEGYAEAAVINDGDGQNYGFKKPSGPRRKGGKRKQKIVIHTSPFLRCLQTSVAISAGISRYNGSQTRFRDRGGSITGSPFAQTRKNSATRSAVSNNNRPLITRNLATQLENIVNKPILRIDAFLGEWNTPDYYDHITPPPDSPLMVAGAMATLRRKAESIDVAQPITLNQGNFPGGWSKPSSPAVSRAESPNPFDAMGALRQALPRDRASSMGNAALAARLSRLSGVKNVGYTPPTPAYAISSTDPIPRGYCAHARDACLDMELDWDSTRQPLEWPDGGQLGEEWNAMHRRFRTGITDMVKWYRGHGMELHVHQDHHDDEAIGDDDEPELILILVTHAAGWNALVGALTEQPVLRDVGTASLTMAIRKDPERRSSTISTSSQPPTPVGDPDHLSSLYEMRVIASTEHLRPGADPAKPSFNASPKITAVTADHLGRRARIGGTEPLPDGSDEKDVPFKLAEPVRPLAMSAALSGIRRSGSNPPPRKERRAFTPPTNPVVDNGVVSSPIELTFPERTVAGLWGTTSSASSSSSSPPRPTHRSNTSTPLYDPALAMPTGKFISNIDSSDPRTAKPPGVKPAPLRQASLTRTTNEQSSSAQGRKTSGGSGSGSGLWTPPGTAPALWNAGDRIKRPAGPKRRWTLGQDEEHEFLVLN